LDAKKQPDIDVADSRAVMACKLKETEQNCLTSKIPDDNYVTLCYSNYNLSYLFEFNRFI